MAIDPSGKFLYATVYIKDRNPDSNYHPESYDVWSYRIDDNGTVTPLAAPALTHVGLASYRMHPSGKLTYLTEFPAPSAPSSGVSAYAIDPSSGTLTRMGQVQADPLNDFDPTGRFAYGTWGSTDSQEIEIHAYSVDADGSLAANGPVQTLPEAEGGTISSASVAPGGKFAYVVNSFAQTISTYAISESGTLTSRNTLTLQGSIYPTSISFEPGGKFAYVVATALTSLYTVVLTYAVDPVTGALTQADSLSAYYPKTITFVSTKG